jgi:hypothetical protein
MEKKKLIYDEDEVNLIICLTIGVPAYMHLTTNFSSKLKEI